MEKVRFSLAGLQEVMEGGHVTTVMQTQVESAPPLSGLCTVELRFEQGKIIACTFSNGHSGLYGFDAFQFLVPLVGGRELQWSAQTTGLLPVTGPLVAKQPSSIAPLAVPVRLRPPTEAEFTSWPRVQRQVYNLIDGAKDAQKIASVLTQKLESVTAALTHLASAKVIGFQAAPNTQEAVEQQFASLFHS